MLWSDPRDEASPEGRNAQRLLRLTGPRLALLLLAFGVLLML